MMGVPRRGTWRSACSTMPAPAFAAALGATYRGLRMCCGGLLGSQLRNVGCRLQLPQAGDLTSHRGLLRMMVVSEI